jgi:hypothetical protein
MAAADANKPSQIVLIKLMCGSLLLPETGRQPLPLSQSRGSFVVTN